MNQTRPIQVVLFDFGGVVVPLAADDLVAQLERELVLDPGRLHALMYEGNLWPDLSVGKLEEEHYWRELSLLVGREPSELQRLLDPVWAPQDADPGVLDIVRALRQRVRVALLSNATLGLEKQMEALGIFDLFDPVINSARVGLRKPDPEVFRYAMRVLDTPAEAILFVDDKERNTQVAEELGIRSVVFETSVSLASALQSHGLLPAPSLSGDR